MRWSRWHLRSVLIVIAAVAVICGFLAHRARAARRAAILGPLAAARLKSMQSLYIMSLNSHVSGSIAIQRVYDASIRLMEAERDAEDLPTVAPNSIRAHLTRMRGLRENSKQLSEWLRSDDQDAGEHQLDDSAEYSPTLAESYCAEAESWAARGSADR